MVFLHDLLLQFPLLPQAGAAARPAAGEQEGKEGSKSEDGERGAGGAAQPC